KPELEPVESAKRTVSKVLTKTKLLGIELLRRNRTTDVKHRNCGFEHVRLIRLSVQIVKNARHLPDPGSPDGQPGGGGAGKGGLILSSKHKKRPPLQSSLQS